MLIVEAAVGRLALLAPGGSNDVNIPMLRFARETARSRGASVHALRWEIGSEELRRQMMSVPLGRIPVSVAQMVHDQAAAALAQLATSGGSPVVFGKSLGSVAADVVADRGLAAVWFTPLLTNPETVAAIQRSDAPCLLVGGTADPWWDRDIALSLTSNIVEIPGADHAMRVAGQTPNADTIPRELTTSVERFLDLVWPS